MKVLSIAIATTMMCASAIAAPTDAPVVGNLWQSVEGKTFSLVDEKTFTNWDECVSFVNAINEEAFGTGFFATCWQIPNSMLEAIEPDTGA